MRPLRRGHHALTEDPIIDTSWLARALRTLYCPQDDQQHSRKKPTSSFPVCPCVVSFHKVYSQPSMPHYESSSLLDHHRRRRMVSSSLQTISPSCPFAFRPPLAVPVQGPQLQAGLRLVHVSVRLSFCHFYVAMVNRNLFIGTRALSYYL